MADLNFTTGINTAPYEAGLSKMVVSTNKAANDIQGSLGKIKPPTLDTKGRIPTAADLGILAGRSAIAGFSEDLNKLKTGFSAAGSGAVAFGNNLKASVINSTTATVNAFGQATTATKQYNQALRNELGASFKRIANEEGPSLRYALYDVAGTLQQVAATAGAAGVAVLTMSAKYETAFTDIERTTMSSEASLGVLKSQFMALSHEIPLAFGELTRIGSLGAQMGIADSELSGFTETVAQFSATTNVSIDSAAQSFGALKNLLDIDATGFTALGSAVAYVGINSVATETEVLSVATAIGGVAAQAGTSKEFVIGLAGSLASLRVPAEQSRGALTRVFQEINRSSAEGGPALQNFANIMGMTADQAKSLAQTSMEEFFLKFNQSLSGLDAQQLTQALDSVNLSDIRVTNTLARLSSNMDVVNKSMADSAYGFANSGVLAALYANKSEDLASKFQILINSLSELAAKLGDAVSPTFGAFIDWLAKRAQDLSVALSTGAGKAIAQFAGAVGAATTVVFGLAGAIALGTASLAAFNFVKDKLGISAMVQGIGSLTTAWIAEATSTNVATAATNGFKVALISTGIGAAIVLLGTLAASFATVGTDADSANAAFSNMVSNTSGLSAAMEADRVAREQALLSGNQTLLDSYVAVSDGLYANTEATDTNRQSVENAASVLGLAVPALNAQNSALSENIAWLGDNTRAWIKNQLIQSETFRNMAGNADFMNYFSAIGGNMDEVINAAAVDGQQGVINYFKRLEITGVGAAAIASKKISSAFQLVGAGRLSGMASLGDLKNGPWAVVSNSIGDISKSLPGLAGAMRLTGDETAAAATTADDYAGSLGGVGDAADTAKQKIYTLVDYANDLSSVFERAFDIRFSAGETLDKISSAFSKIAKSTADARAEINSLNADISKLNADKALQQYFLSVAEAYGDTLKAQEIRANLAKIDSDLTAKTKSLEKAQEKTNKTLVGNSDAAIENRSEILGLISSYQNHIKALASSGLSQDELRRKTDDLRQDFIDQATQLGYNQDELGLYALAFDDVATAIDNVPRDITVTANTNPALQALNEFEAKMREMSGKTYSGGTIGAPNTGNGAAIAEADSKIKYYAGVISELSTRRPLPWFALDSALSSQQYWKNQLTSLRGYDTGGYTGAGGKYDVAGIVHRGEYVVPKEQVNQATKMPYFMEQPRSFAQGGYVGAGPSTMMVSLSPEDRAILRSAGGSGEIVLYANNEAIARSANMGNKQIVAAGGRP